jgi:hypothetical protein
MYFLMVPSLCIFIKGNPQCERVTKRSPATEIGTVGYYALSTWRLFFRYRRSFHRPAKCTMTMYVPLVPISTQILFRHNCPVKP